MLRHGGRVCEKVGPRFGMGLIYSYLAEMQKIPVGVITMLLFVRIAARLVSHVVVQVLTCLGGVAVVRNQGHRNGQDLADFRVAQPDKVGRRSLQAKQIRTIV